MGESRVDGEFCVLSAVGRLLHHPNDPLNEIRTRWQVLLVDLSLLI